MLEPVAREVSERQVDPMFLVRDIHQTNHAKYNLLVGHISDILDDGAILLTAEPRPRKVLVQLRDNLRATLREPCRPFLLLQLEHCVVKFLPQLKGMRGNLVDGFAELRLDSQIPPVSLAYIPSH